jgi:hypothetical protein
MELDLNSIGVQMHPQYHLPLDEYPIWNVQDSWPPGMFQEFPTFTNTSLLQQEDLFTELQLKYETQVPFHTLVSPNILFSLY